MTQPPVRPSASPTPNVYAPPSPPSTDGAPTRRSFMELLSLPWVDRTIAIVASAPFAVELYRRYTSDDLSFPRAVLGLNTALLVVTMLVRRPPKRVTPNPWFWLLAFVATYGILAIAAFGQRGRPLVPWWTSNTLAMLSVAIGIWGRLSLGRNIGFVPAQRQLALSGAYRFVRHPIYTALFVSLAGFILRAYSVANVVAALTVIGLFHDQERDRRAVPETGSGVRRVSRPRAVALGAGAGMTVLPDRTRRGRRTTDD